MAFVVPALAAIGGGSAAVGAMTVASLAATTYAASQAGKTQAPAPAAAVEPPPKPQASKNADRNSALAANAAGAMPGGAMAGNSSTFLTGPSGVDTGTLNLGKNTLLGQ